MLIVIDKDWLETSGLVEFRAGDVAKTAINWWIKELNKFVEVRKDHLYNKKPGALASTSEPRFIWVTMVKRPIVCNDKLASIFSLTRKFNTALEDCLANDRHSHIIKMQLPTDESIFDGYG